MVAIVIVVVIACAMASPFLRTDGLHEWRVARVAELAAKLRDGRVEAAVARGTLDGVEVAVTLRSPRHGGLAAIARAGGPTGALSMSLRPRRRGDAGLDAIAIAPDFDRDYVVVGAPADRVRALFDDTLRSRVRDVRRAWARLDATGARVERPGFGGDRDTPTGELAVARLAASLIQRGAAVGDPRHAPVAMPELRPRQVWQDEHIVEHKLLVSLAIGAWLGAMVLFAWWAGVGV